MCSSDLAYFVEAMALLEGAAILFIRGAEYNLGRLEEAGNDHYTRFHFPLSSVTSAPSSRIAWIALGCTPAGV